MKGSSTVAVKGQQAIPKALTDDLAHPDALRAPLARSLRYLLGLQKPDGHWVGELQGDTILESEFILLMAFLGKESVEQVARAARYVLGHQLREGGWNNYPGGPVELSVSVKAYFALKLAGHDPEAEYMRRARRVIRSLGGAAGCNSFTKFYLALLGQFPYDNCPAVPPEMMFLPRWSYFNIYAMSSWTRTIVIPLTIFYAHKPVRALPPERGIRELFVEPPETPLWPHPPTPRLLTWTNFFLALDRACKWVDARGLGSIRRASLKLAERWMLEHFEDSDGVGAIFPPMIYTAVSLRCLGYSDASPEMAWALKQLEDLMIDEGDTTRLQPCLSPVWDTALTLNALADAGVSARHPAIEKGVRWLLDREVRRRGDWSVTNPGLEPGGWFFEYRNGLYPDIDDTAMVLMAFAKIFGGMARPTANGKQVPGEQNGLRLVSGNGTAASVDNLAAATRPAMERGLRWLLAMQNDDGGWAAFDRGINRELLTRVPFADHNAMLDPSCPDITARVLEALGYLGFCRDNPQVRRALAFLEKTQEPAGCWWGRWGVNYIYGTWQVLVGLGSIGFDMQHPLVRRAVNWLKHVQQPGGGWGETCRSYDDPTLAGQGVPTASQTAWALLGLLAAGEGKSPEVEAGIEYLAATQQADGNWHEDQFTGTGFPKVFYLRYHLYRLYFPLMALARYEKERKQPAEDGRRRPVHGRSLEPA